MSDKPQRRCDRSAAVARLWAVAAAWACQAPSGGPPAGEVGGIGLLARLGDALDELAVGNADVARAVADAGPGVSLTARVLYEARQRLRAAGVPAAASSPTSGPGVRLEVPDVEAARDHLHGSGLIICTPSDCLLPQHGTGGQAAMWHLLRVAASGDRNAYRLLLAGEPFGLDPSQADLIAAIGLAGGAAQPSTSRLRVSREGREAALCVQQVVEAIRSAAGRPDAMRTAASRAALTCGGTNGATTPLDVWAELADTLWAGIDETRLPMGVRLILFAYACEERVWSGLPCVPEGATPLRDSASLFFEDRCPPACDLALLAHAVGLDDEALRTAYEGRLAVYVTSSLADATAAWALAGVDVRRRRTWPAPDTPAPILAPAMTFSASRLNTYAQCPRRWFYEYLCGVLPDPTSPAAAYGQAMHAALEAVHREVRIPSRHDAADILMRLDGEVQRAFAQRRDAFPTELEYAASLARARRMAEQYVRWLAAETARRPVEITGVEVLQRSRFGDHEFVGFIDRIDRPLAGGPVCIYDYKTGRIEDDASAYLERVRRGAEAQLPLYYAMRAAAGERVGRVALVSLRDPKDEVWLLALDILDEGEGQRPTLDGVVSVRCTERDLEAALAALLETCDLLTKQGCERFVAGATPPCTHCAYQRACREKPIDTERIFAR